MYKEENNLLTRNAPSNEVLTTCEKTVVKKDNLEEDDVVLYAVLDKKLEKEGMELDLGNEPVPKNL